MSDTREHTPSRDAVTIARFIVGWWPGLEDGMSWPEDVEQPSANPVYAAAKRILAEAPK